MGSLIVILTAVAIYCSETYCDSPVTAFARPKNIGLKRNDSRVIERGTFWENLGSPRRISPKTEESTKSLNGTSNEANRRKARLLGSLAFLAGLSFGGLATAASSTVKSVARMPPQAASFTLNLGSSKGSLPSYLSAYYNPYSLPYPFFYHGSFGLVPTIDPTKLQPASPNNLTPQVISVFDNRQPSDLPGNNVEYEEKDVSDDDRSASANDEDEVDYRAELRAEANRNAEEKVMILGCKQDHRKHSGSFRGSVRERENLRVNADELRTTLKLQAANAISADANQNVTANATTVMNTTTSASNISTTTENPHIRNHTQHPHFPGYLGGYPQHISNVDLTADSHAHQYYGHSPINYNLPHERPANFYHEDNYDAYSSPLVNSHFAGSFPSDQVNEYVGADYNRVYTSEYHSPYSGGFTPVK